jgi:hypothetical protein
VEAPVVVPAAADSVATAAEAVASATVVDVDAVVIVAVEEDVVAALPVATPGTAVLRPSRVRRSLSDPLEPHFLVYTACYIDLCMTIMTYHH